MPGKAANGVQLGVPHLQQSTGCLFPRACGVLSLTGVAPGPHRLTSALLSAIAPPRTFSVLSLLPSEVMLFFKGTYSSSSKCSTDSCIPQFMPGPHPVPVPMTAGSRIHTPVQGESRRRFCPKAEPVNQGMWTLGLWRAVQPQFSLGFFSVAGSRMVEHPFPLVSGYPFTKSRGWARPSCSPRLGKCPGG